jgi:hypothetical protein
MILKPNNKKIAFLSFLLFLIQNTNAQDTIRLAPSIHYSEMDYELARMGPERAREDVVFNERHKKVEYCYYLNNKRICSGEEYRLIGDSILQIGDSLHLDQMVHWTYKKRENGQYFVKRQYYGVCESGIASDLMPLIKLNDFATLSQETQDTLWVANVQYYNKKYKRRGIAFAPKFRHPMAKIEGKIYEIDKVEQLPTFMNNDSLPKIIGSSFLNFLKKGRMAICYGEPFIYVKNMSFIVTKSGEIKNIQQNIGSIDIDDCTSLLRELMLFINQFGRLKPAKIKGRSVNVKYILNVGN